MKRETATALINRLNEGLPPSAEVLRRILRLRAEGVSVAEIAERLGMQADAVSARIRRAKKRRRA